MFRLVLIALMAAVTQSAPGDNEFSKLMIPIPQRLNKEDGYRHLEAMFGVPQFGGFISQNVYYADSNLCNPNVDTHKGYPKRRIEKDGKMASWPSPFILMVDKGGCNFVSKVRNAQHAGAAAVLIANTDCICSEKDCQQRSGFCTEEEPSMVDDGSGSDISIPAFLMYKQDADKIKEELKGDVPIVVEMAWSIPSEEKVKLDLWTVPTDEVTRSFLLNFKDVARQLGEHLSFTPHMYLLDGLSKDCQYNRNGERWCERGCTNNGHYCALDPDHDVDSGISGADVVKESLRRVCIWKNFQQGWWDYVVEFTERCDNPDYFSNDDCVRDAYRYGNINENDVNNCMEHSGGLEGDSNWLLDDEVRASDGIVVFPTMKVNNAELRGSLTVSNVFSAICTGFATNAAPETCVTCASCSDLSSCLELGYCTSAPIVPTSSTTSSSSGGGVSAWTFMFSLLFVVGGFAGLGYWYYKKTREEMRDRVRDILAEYMPLEDQEETGGVPPAQGGMFGQS